MSGNLCYVSWKCSICFLLKCDSEKVCQLFPRPKCLGHCSCFGVLTSSQFWQWLSYLLQVKLSSRALPSPHDPKCSQDTLAYRAGIWDINIPKQLQQLRQYFPQYDHVFLCFVIIHETMWVFGLYHSTQPLTVWSCSMLPDFFILGVMKKRANISPFQKKKLHRCTTCQAAAGSHFPISEKNLPNFPDLWKRHTSVPIDLNHKLGCVLFICRYSFLFNLAPFWQSFPLHLLFFPRGRVTV